MNNDFQDYDSKNQAAMTRIIAGRLYEARNLCLFSVEHAAFLIGITQKELELIESKRVVGREPAPHFVIFKASKVYDVSIDYLFGGNEDWELTDDARGDRNLLSCLNTSYFLQYKHADKVIARQDARLKVVEATVGALPDAVRQIGEALSRFRELNPEFDDLKGGASLVNRVRNAAVIAHRANCDLVRHKSLPIERIYELEPLRA